MLSLIFGFLQSSCFICCIVNADTSTRRIRRTSPVPSRYPSVNCVTRRELANESAPTALRCLQQLQTGRILGDGCKYKKLRSSYGITVKELADEIGLFRSGCVCPSLPSFRKRLVRDD